MKQLNQISNRMKCNMKGAVFANALCLSLICLTPSLSYAEGTNARGGFGVNRRVETDAGYTKVWGNFTVSELTAPNTATTIRNRTKPTMYFGAAEGVAHTDTISEGGLQYEQARLLGSLPLPAGWVLFMRWSNSDLNNNVENPEGWIQAYQPQGTTFVPVQLSSVSNLKVTYEILSGGEASLDVDGVGTFYSQPLNPWKWVSQGNQRPTTLYPSNPAMAERIFTIANGVVTGGNIRVRRVIGITQDNNLNLHGAIDGSSMTAKFSEGRVAAFDATNLGTPTPNNWLPARVNQDRTGYDVGARLPGVAPPNGPRYVVEFPNIDALPGHTSTDTPAEARRVARLDTALSYALTEDSVTRYENETVRTTLRSNPAGRGRVRRRGR